jgi:hypothetical protein
VRSVVLGVLSGALCVALAASGASSATSSAHETDTRSGVRARDGVVFDVQTSRGTAYAARARADGTRFRRLTHPNRRFISSALSPDRSMLMIHEYPMVVDVAAPDGAGRHRVLDSTANQWAFQPVWSPDSSTLLVTADMGSGPELLAVPVDGSAPVHLAYAGETTAYNVAPAGWSPDGSLGVFKGTGQDPDGTERPAYLRVRRTGGGLQELTGWQSYAARPGGLTGVAAVRTDSGTEVVKVGRQLGVRRVLLDIGRSGPVTALVWSADGRRFAILRGEPGRQRLVVLSASGRVVARIVPRQPAGAGGSIGSLQISSGGSVVNWSYTDGGADALSESEGLFLHDVARTRTCRKAPPGREVWWLTVHYAPDDRYAVVEKGDTGVRGLVPLDRPGRLERVVWAPSGAAARNAQFLRPTRSTVATRPCRAS